VNINRTHLREIGWEVVEWIQLAQVRNQWRVLLKIGNDEPLVSVKGGNFLTSSVTVSKENCSM